MIKVTVPPPPPLEAASVAGVFSPLEAGSVAGALPPPHALSTSPRITNRVKNFSFISSPLLIFSGVHQLADVFFFLYRQHPQGK
jgi:hypothetical protein